MKPLRRLLAAPFAALALVAILLASGHAQAPPIRPAVLSGLVDRDAVAWRAAVLGAGGTVSAAQLGRVDRLARCLKVGGVWPVADRIWLLAAENSTQSLVDLLARATATATNSPTFTAFAGWAGNGTTAFINLNVAASALAQASTNGMHVAHYLTAYNGGGSPDAVATGSLDGTRTSFMYGTYSDAKIYPRLGDGGAAGVVSAGGAGFYVADRISSSQAVAARNGADLGTVSTAAGARSTASLYALGLNNNGSVASAISSATRIGFVSLGASLGAAGRLALSGCVNGYMGAVGAATY